MPLFSLTTFDYNYVKRFYFIFFIFLSSFLVAKTAAKAAVFAFCEEGKGRIKVSFSGQCPQMIRYCPRGFRMFPWARAIRKKLRI